MRPWVWVAAAAAEEAAAEEGTINEGSEAQDKYETGVSYDYLLSMPLWNLTQEKVDELCAEKVVKTGEVKAGRHA